jgi:hypothetical protein
LLCGVHVIHIDNNLYGDKEGNFGIQDFDYRPCQEDFDEALSEDEEIDEDD